jgi:integrase
VKQSPQQTQPSDQSEKEWQKTPYTGLLRYVSSGTYFARIRVKGKLVQKSLKTKTLSVAKLRLDDLQKLERQKVGHGRLVAQGKVMFQDALAIYREKGFRPVVPRNKKEARPLKPAAFAYYEQRADALVKSWPALPKTEIRKLTEKDCVEWADKARRTMSPTVFNHTLGLLRNVIDFGIKAGARYDNPAKAVMRESEGQNALQLPDPARFDAFVAEIENGGSGFSKPCADLVRFMAFGGFRKGEAAFVTWADCDSERSQITVRGHPETGLKNRQPGETRYVPMIPEMVTLLGRLKKERPDAQPTDAVMKVQECQKAMDRAARLIGMERITHHDLRHLFATRCIESGVDIPTVSRWLGHKDGGALAMKVYGHLRDHHSAAMAQKVSFSVKPESKCTEPAPAPANQPGLQDRNS